MHWYTRGVSLGAPHVAATTGPVETELALRAIRFAGLVRVGVAALCVLLGLLAAPDGRLVVTTGATVGLVAWSACLLRLLPRRRLPGRWLLADVAVTAAVCLTQTWTVPDGLPHGNTWVCVQASAAVITYQWRGQPVPGLLAATAVVLADLLGVGGLGGRADRESLISVLWIGVQAGLSMLAMAAIRRAARAVDREVRLTTAAQRVSRIDEARRVAESRHLTTLHDTACATLLLASTATSSPQDRVALRRQARRDLEALAGVDSARRAQDLRTTLLDEFTCHPLGIRHDIPAGLVLPARVTSAIRMATAEALRNVRRHAGSATASVTVVATSDGVRLDVVDTGIGFDADRRSWTGARGLTRSVHERMRDVGGHAVVRSRPGRGTTVCLEWSRG